MDDRFKNLNQRRHREWAALLLVLLSVLMLVCNRFVYPLVGFPATEFRVQLSCFVVGVVIAQFPLLAVWTVLSSQSFIRRIQFLFFSSLMLIAAWLLGLISRMDVDMGINWENREPIYFLGCLPLMLLATGLPLIGLRFFWSRVLAPMDAIDPPTRQPVSIAGLMTATATVALVLSATQTLSLIDMSQADVLSACGMFAGMFFLAGLLITLPAVLILCSPNRNLWIWMPVVFGGSLIPTIAVLVVIMRVFRNPISDIQEPLLVVTAAMVVFLAGITIIRLFGYRIRKAEPVIRSK